MTNFFFSNQTTNRMIMMIHDLFQYQLSEQQSVGMFLMNHFLQPHDWRGLYGSCTFFKILLTETCPVCKKPMAPRKKIAFHRAMQGRILDLPSPPCGTTKCDRHIFGHYNKNKKYSLCLFTKKFDTKRCRRWTQIAEENREEEFQYQKAYRRSGYNIMMSSLSF